MTLFQWCNLVCKIIRCIERIEILKVVVSWYILGPTYRIGGVQTSRTKGSVMKVQRWWFVNYNCTKMKNGFYVRVINLHDTLENVCNSLLRKSHHWLVVGVVNIDMNQENLLSTFCNTHDLENLVKGSTCFKGENSTCIDVILSNEPNRFKSTININCSLSDFHNIVCAAPKLQCPPESDRKLFYRSYRKFNEESYTEDLQNMPLSVCDVFDDRIWGFHKLVTDVMDINAPVKWIVIDKPSVPYMNGSLRRNIHYRNMLRNKYRGICDLENIQETTKSDHSNV